MIDAIIGEYKNAAIKYGEFTGVNARKANKQHDIIVNCYLQLKELESIGSLKELLGDEDDNVRLWAGSHLFLALDSVQCIPIT